MTAEWGEFKRRYGEIRKLAAPYERHLIGLTQALVEFVKVDVGQLIDHLDLVRRTVVCSYCGEQSEAETAEQRARVMTEHILSCASRPEARMARYIVFLESALITAVDDIGDPERIALTKAFIESRGREEEDPPAPCRGCAEPSQDYEHTCHECGTHCSHESHPR